LKPKKRPRARVTTDAGAMRLSLDVVGAAVCGRRKVGPNMGWRGKSPAIYFWLAVSLPFGSKTSATCQRQPGCASHKSSKDCYRRRMKLRYAVRYLEELSVVACISTVSGGNAGLPQNLQTRNLQTLPCGKKFLCFTSHLVLHCWDSRPSVLPVRDVSMPWLTAMFRGGVNTTQSRRKDSRSMLIEGDHEGKVNTNSSLFH
jgi:hypothetical protein